MTGAIVFHRALRGAAPHGQTGTRPLDTIYAACAGLGPPSEFGPRFGGLTAGILRFEAFALVPFDGDLITSSVRSMSARIARNLSAADSPI